jgi:transcriptional regulator GlxA family with amidase domain
VSRRTVGILIFDDAEVLDVCGPYEVFSVAGRRQGLEPFDVRLLAKEPGPVMARNGFVMTPHGTLREARRSTSCSCRAASAPDERSMTPS